jgi:eukaryotic-like serine/threonine-protein kinase
MTEPSLARLSQALVDGYRIERELGAGGMATVYLAEDLRHHREVAIKVLRPELAAVIGAERFVREIKTIASLQHPHILGLIDSGEVDGLAYYVMPFVEGESLRARLLREKQLPVADAVRFAREVASALDYAHRHGVIHRDIKPENILLHDGQALVVDFGIALAASTAGGTRMTETGMTVGTPHYMSPEQAMGEREISARSDVYALGAVTYEMLAGEPPFTGPTAQAIVAKVMTTDPVPLVTHRRNVPPQVDAAVITALQKVPADRFQSAAEFAAALESPARWPARVAGPRARSRQIGLGVALALMGIVGFIVGRTMRNQGAARFSIGEMRKVTWDDGMETVPALSPDGRSVAYGVGTGTRMRIYVRQVTGGRALPITDDSTTVEWGPRWSGDGSRVLFVTPQGVFSAPAGGGTARQEIPRGYGPVTSATWSPKGNRIAFAVGDTLFLREEDATIHALARLDQPAMCTWGPRDLVACSAGNPFYAKPGSGFGNLGPSRIVVVRVADGAVHTVSDTSVMNLSPAWLPAGWLLYLSNRDGPAEIYARRIAADGASRDDPVRLTAGLNAASFSTAADGSRLAFASNTVAANVWSLPIPAHPPASMARATQVTSGSQVVESISISADGQWLLYDSDIAGNTDIYRMKLPAGRPEQLTRSLTDEFSPGLSPDNRILAFHAWRGTSREIFLKSLDGGPLVQLTATPTTQEARPRWSPDGKALTWYEVFRSGGLWVSRRRADGEWVARRRLDSGHWPAWSPDGALLSYSTDQEAGQPMVIQVDSGMPRALIPGSTWPKVTTSGWSRDARTVYFKGVDSTGVTGIWAWPRAGGSPRLMARLDDPILVPERHTFAVGADRFFFVLYNRQSDVWLMHLRVPGSR